MNERMNKQTKEQINKLSTPPLFPLFSISPFPLFSISPFPQAELFASAFFSTSEISVAFAEAICPQRSSRLSLTGSPPRK